MDTSSGNKASVFSRVLPSFGVLTLFLYPLAVLMYPAAMIKDPGIGWHLVSGQYMLENKVILNQDLFSFTKPGHHWITFEWLFQCFAAGLEKIGGLPLLIAVTALIYGSIPVLLYRRTQKDGSNIYISLVLLFISYFALMNHCHARPHIFTYFFFTILLEKLFFYDQDRINSNSLFLFIPVMIPWSNLHGGFAVGLAVSGLAFIVTLCRFLYLRDPGDLKKTKTYFLFGFGLTLASMVNIHGWNLHIGILKFFSLEFVHTFQEFASPNFNYGGVGVKIFEFALLIFIFRLAQKKNKISLLELVFVLFFIYQSLHAMRHMFLFFILITPILAREFTNMINTDSWLSRRAEMVAAEQSQIKSDKVWVPCICAAFISLSLLVPNLFKGDLYGINLTSGAGIFVKDNIDKFQRPFNTDNIGGALIYHFWPDVKVFFDDRLDLYGDDFFENEYTEVLHVKPDWEKVLDKYEVTSAIIANESLATLMKASSNWNLVYEDNQNHLFLRNNN